MDDYPTYEEWISHFDMDSETPDMKKLEKWHFSPLPVWSEGNVYLNGAKACKNEKNGLADDQTPVFVELDENGGDPILRTNIYAIIKGFKTGMIGTDTLGEAFEPQQRFENTDGTDIMFDTDYLGNHRGLDILPGPFAEGSDTYTGLWMP